MLHYKIWFPKACFPGQWILWKVQRFRAQPVQPVLPDRWWWRVRAGEKQPQSSRWRRPSAPMAQQSDPSTRSLLESLLSERRWKPDRPNKRRVVSTPTVITVSFLFYYLNCSDLTQLKIEPHLEFDCGNQGVNTRWALISYFDMCFLCVCTFALLPTWGMLRTRARPQATMTGVFQRDIAPPR